MDIVARVQAILLKPKDEWVKIKAEPATAAGLFTSYAMVLAAIPAGCQLLGNILVGRRLPVVGLYRWAFGRALSNAVLTYVLSLATVYLFALIINELAPNFGSAKNMTNALKLAVYSMTPGWVAGVLYVIPALWVLGILASLYGLFILYLGFETPLMETPKDRAAAYFGVSVLVVVALYIVVNWFLKVIFAVRYGRL
jgi:Yip1 domain